MPPSGIDRIRCIGPGPVRIGALLALMLVGELAWALYRTPGIGGGDRRANGGRSPMWANSDASCSPITCSPLKSTSILIIAAMLGAVLLARRPGVGE